MLKYLKLTVLGFVCGLILNSCATPKVIPKVAQSEEPSEPVSLVFNINKDPLHPTVVLVGVITDASALRLDTAMVSDIFNGAQDVTLIINSPGGYVSGGFKIVGVMNGWDIPIHCIVDGDAKSMAFYILQNCTDRTATKKSSLMVHEPHATIVDGTRYELRKQADILDKLSKTMNESEAKRMGMTVQELEAKIENKDWDMSPDEALKAHAIDKIIDSVTIIDYKKLAAKLPDKE